MPRDALSIQGSYRLRCVDRDGFLKWETRLDNAVTVLGCNAILDRNYRSDAVSPWYFGLIDGTGYGVGPATTDTFAAHPGWSEFAGLASRPLATFPAATAGQSLSNTAALVLTSGGSIRGVLMCNVSFLSATSGLLHSTAVAPANFAVSPGDTVYVSYLSKLRN